MYWSEKTRNIILIVLAVCLIGITVAYATLSQNLNISGVAKVGKTSWNIHFTKVLTPKAEGYAEGGKATLNSDSTVLTVSEGILKVPGDTITYVFDVINEGDLDAEVETVLTTIDSCKASDDTTDVTMYCDKIKYDLVYQDTKEAVKKNDQLLKGESKTLNLIITYDKNKELTSLPNTEIVLDNITSTINYTMIQKSSGSTEEPQNKIVCKRATTLHTEECTQKDTTNYCGGAGYTIAGSRGTTTITYGNLGTSGTLTTGDAFDCDVNGDGVYDSNTERFYYVSDYYNTSTKAFESDTAVLIYYNNVSSGNSNNKTTYAYDSSGENFHGPRTAIKELPTTSQWSNISLKNTTRSILNESGSGTTTGGTLPNDFSYVEYAARFLTVQETNIACKTNGVWDNGKLNSCIYMLENTSYESNNIVNSGYWLENALSSDAGGVWTIYSANVYIDNYYVSYTGDFGVRPAIEVSKTNMEY